MHPMEALKWCFPSILTVGALVCGLTALRLASEGDFRSCVICIFFSALLDGLDGHAARALGTSSDIGFQLDSLCDLANFGVIPALTMYFWANSLPPETTGIHRNVLWAACCMFCTCAALRLARFNVQGHLYQMNQQHLQQKKGGEGHSVSAYISHNLLRRKLFFQGIPAPVGAMYALLPLTLSLSDLPNRYFGFVGEPLAWAVGRRGTVCILIITGFLMVSSLPTISSKMVKRDARDSHLRSRCRKSAVAKLLAAVLLLGSFLAFPFESFILMVLVHMLSLPVGVVMYYWYAVEDPPAGKRE